MRVIWYDNQADDAGKYVKIVARIAAVLLIWLNAGLQDVYAQQKVTDTALAATGPTESAAAVSSAPYEVWLQKGSLAYALGNTEQAFELLKEALKSPDRDDKVYLLLAKIDARRDKSERAAVILERGLKKFPDSSPMRFELVSLLIKLDKLEAAERHLDKFTLRAKESPRYKYYVALIAFKRGRVDQSIEGFSALGAADSPYRGDAFYWLGYARLAQKQSDEALQAFREVLHYGTDRDRTDEAREMIAKLKPQPVADQWLLSAAAGIEYDSNVLLASGDFVSGNSAGRGFGVVSLRAHPLLRETWAFGFGAMVYQNGHVGSSVVKNFNITYLDPALRAVWGPSSRWLMELQVGYSSVWMFFRDCGPCDGGIGKDKLFSTRLYESLRLQFAPTKADRLSLLLNAGWDDFRAGNTENGYSDRDTYKLGSMSVGLWNVAKIKAFDLGARAVYTHNAVEGDEFDAESVAGSLDVQYAINKQWSTTLALSYETIMYPHHLYDRLDQIVTVEAGGRWAVTDKSGLSLRGIFENNHGTVGTGGPASGYKYERWNAGLSYDYLILRK